MSASVSRVDEKRAADPFPALPTRLTAGAQVLQMTALLPTGPTGWNPARQGREFAQEAWTTGRHLEDPGGSDQRRCFEEARAGQVLQHQMMQGRASRTLWTWLRPRIKGDGLQAGEGV